MSVTPIWTVARNVSGSLWRSLTRFAARLPSATRASTLLRRAEMSAISLPEKKPFPSSNKKIATIRSVHSLMGWPKIPI